jgi:hypothetical protein
MAKRVTVSILGMALAFTALEAGAFTREAGVRMEREVERRDVSVSASRNGSQIRPGREIVRRNGSVDLDSLTVINRAESANVSGSLSQDDTGQQRALNGTLDLSE